MPEQQIVCPECGAKIRLDQALLQPFLERERSRLEAEHRGKEKENEKRIAEAARKKAREELKLEMGDLNNQVTELKDKVEKANKREMDLRTEKRKLEERKAEFELEMQRKLDDERAKINADAEKKANDQHKLREQELKKRVDDLLQELEEAKTRAQQGSQQMQGEILELNLETVLAESFPNDKIEPVPKGQPGGDILHRVRNASGRICGTILWEAKRTKNWSDKWITKLKEDQRAVSAEAAVLSSQALPDGVQTFGTVEGVVVANYECALPVAAMLREKFIEIDRTKRAGVGRSDKQALVYEYLTSTEFTQTAQAIAEAILHAKNDLEKEKLTFQRMWKKREAQLEKGLRGLVSMWGTIQGHIGSLPDLAVLGALDGGAETRALPGGDKDSDGT
jgi:hypothetical protein